MSFDIIKQMGLGFVLEFTDKTSKEARTAAKEIHNLKSEVQDLTKDFVKQAETIEKQQARSRQMMVQGASIMAGGAALLAPIYVAGRKGMQDEHTWIGRVTQAMAQQNLSRQDAVRMMAREKEFVDDLANSRMGIPADKLDEAFIRQQGLMNNSAAAFAAYEQVMQMAVVTNTDAVASVEAYNTAWQIFKASMGQMTEQEKALKITNALSLASRRYGAGVTDIAEGLKFMTEEAGIMNPRLETMLAMMTPLLAMGKPGRMASSAVSAVMTNMLNFDQKAKDLRRDLAKQPATLAEFQRQQEVRAGITPELSRLMKVQMTGPNGQMRGFADIVADIESAMGVTREAVAAIDARVKAGTLPEEQRMAALGFSADAQRALVNSFGIQIGNFIGKSEAIKRMEGEFGNTAYLTESFGAATDDATFQLQILRNQFSNLAEDLGTNLLPLIKDFAKEVRPWIADLTEFAKNNPGFVKTALVGGGIAGGVAELGGGAMVLGGAAMNTYLGYKSWRLMREIKAASSGVGSVADDAAISAAKAAASQADEVAKEIVKQTASSVDDAFFNEFTTAKELSRNVLGEAVPFIDDAATVVARETQRSAARQIAGMFGKGAFGAAKGFLPLAAAAIIPTPFDTELGYSPDVERALRSGAIRHGDIAANLVETGMFNPLGSQRMGTVMQRSPEEMMAGMMALMKVYGEVIPAQSDQVPRVQQSFGNIYIIPPAGSDPMSYVKAFDEYTQERADRSADAQH